MDRLDGLDGLDGLGWTDGLDSFCGMKECGWMFFTNLAS